MPGKERLEGIIRIEHSTDHSQKQQTILIAFIKSDLKEHSLLKVFRSTPYFSKRCPKSSSHFTSKLLFSKLAQEVTLYLGDFWKKIYCQELSTVAQSDHTDRHAN